MGIVIRQSIKSTVWAYVGVALGTITTLWLYPKFLTPAQLGLTTGVLLSLASILSQIAMLGTGNSSFYFVAHFNHQQKQPKFFGYLIKISLAGMALVTLLYIGFKPLFIKWYNEKSALFLDYYWLVIPFTICVVFYNSIEAYTRAQKDIVFTNFTREVMLRLLNIAALILFAFHFISFRFFVWLFVMSYGFIFLMLVINNRNKSFFKIDFKSNFDEIISKGEIFRYGFFNVLAGSAWTIANSIDSLMLAGYSLSDAGVYRLAFFICSVVQMPQRTITQILLPLLGEHWKENNLQKIDELYKKSSLQLIIASGFLVMILFINIDTFLGQLPVAYRAAKWVVVLMCFSKLIDMATSINGEIIQTSKFYKFNLYLIVALLFFTIVANYFLIPIYGLLGAAIATTLTNVFFNVVKYLYVYFKFHLQPFTRETALVLSLTILIGTLCFFIPALKYWWLDIAIRTFAASVLFGLSLTLLKISPEINQLIQKAFHKISPRKN